MTNHLVNKLENYKIILRFFPKTSLSSCYPTASIYFTIKSHKNDQKSHIHMEHVYHVMIINHNVREFLLKIKNRSVFITGIC